MGGKFSVLIAVTISNVQAFERFFPKHFQCRQEGTESTAPPLCRN